MSASAWAGLSPPYKTICADPPWRLRQAGVTKADARKFYSTMAVEDIAALPVEELAGDSCHLYLWAVNAMVEEAHGVARAWGFSPVTMLTWCKRGPGVGHYFRNSTEHLVFATKGDPMTPADKPLSTWYLWPRTPHSVKPPASYDLIESVSPGPYVELFCRAPRLGWDSWGWGYEGQVA